MKSTPVARERRHTLWFLAETSSFSPVFLDTDVDMTAVAAHRAQGQRYSITAYVLHSAARVLQAHPEANAAIRGGIRPRVARYPQVNGKFTLDRTLNGRRIVLSAVLPGLQDATLKDIQQRLDHFREGDPAAMPEFAGVRLLHSLPLPLGWLLFRLGARPLDRRPAVMGTFAVTSLGHRAVDSFHSVGGTTVTLGVGRICDRPAVRDGELAIAPIMRLSLAFDHRVIDGAEAADVLTEIKAALEGFGEDTTSSAMGVPA